MEPSLLLSAPKRRAGAVIARANRASSTSSGEDSRPSTPGAGAEGASSSNKAGSGKTTASPEFHFEHDWRVALVLLPALYIVVNHAGHYSKICFLLGIVATYALNAVQFAREHAVISVWLTLFVLVVGLWVSFIGAFRISPWNLLLAHNMTQVLFLTGLWGALQFPWMWRENPKISRLMERFLVGLTPFPCSVLFCWYLSESFGMEAAAFLAATPLTLTFVLLGVDLPRSENVSTSKRLSILTKVERIIQGTYLFALPVVMIMATRLHGSDLLSTVLFAFSLVLWPFVLVRMLPTAEWRASTLPFLSEAFLNIGAGLGVFCGILSVMKAVSTGHISAETEVRALILVCALPVALIGLDNSNISLKVRLFNIMQVALLLVLNPQNHPLLCLAVTTFVILISSMARGGHAGLTLVRSILIGLIIGLENGALGVFLMSVLLLAEQSADINPNILQMVQGVSLVSGVLVEGEIVQRMSVWYRFAFLLASSGVFVGMKGNEGWLLNKLALLSASKFSIGKRERRWVKHVHSGLLYLANYRWTVVLVVLLGRCLAFASQNALIVAILMTTILLSTIVPWPQVSAVFLLPGLYVLPIWTENDRLARGVASTIIGIFGIHLLFKHLSLFEKVNRSQASVVAAGSLFAVPLIAKLGALWIVNPGAIAVHQNELLCDVGYFGLGLAMLDTDMIPSLVLVFAAAVVLATLPGFTVEMTIMQTLSSLLILKTSRLWRMGAVAGLMFLQVEFFTEVLVTRSTNGDDLKHVADYLGFLLVLFIAINACFERMNTFLTLGFEAEATLEGRLCAGLCFVYICHLLFIVPQHRLFPLASVPILVFGLARLLGSEKCCRLGVVLTAISWILETHAISFVSLQEDWILWFDQAIILVVTPVALNATPGRAAFLLPLLLFALVSVKSWEERLIVGWSLVLVFLRLWKAARLHLFMFFGVGKSPVYAQNASSVSVKGNNKVSSSSNEASSSAKARAKVL